MFVIADGHAGAHAAEFIQAHLLELLVQRLPQQFPDLSELLGGEYVPCVLSCIEDGFHRLRSCVCKERESGMCPCSNGTPLDVAP